MGIWGSRHILIVCLALYLCMPTNELQGMTFEQLQEMPFEQLQEMTFEQLQENTLNKLGPKTPGLWSLLTRIKKESDQQESHHPTRKSLKNYGSIFEIGTAINLSILNQETTALNLTIEFLHEPFEVLINGQKIVLTTTEFDVITDSLAIECKTTHFAQKATINNIVLQAIKETNMINWFKELAKEIEEGKIYYSIYNPNKKSPYLGIKSPSTYNKSIYMRFRNFPTRSNEAVNPLEQLKQELMYLIQYLSNKKIYVFFKDTIQTSLAYKLDACKILYGNNIHELAETNMKK